MQGNDGEVGKEMVGIVSVALRRSAHGGWCIFSALPDQIHHWTLKPSTEVNSQFGMNGLQGLQALFSPANQTF